MTVETLNLNFWLIDVCDKDGKLYILAVQYISTYICSLKRHLEENGRAEANMLNANNHITGMLNCSHQFTVVIKMCVNLYLEILSKCTTLYLELISNYFIYTFTLHIYCFPSISLPFKALHAYV